MTHNDRRDRDEVQLAKIRSLFEPGEPLITEEIEERLGLRHREVAEKLEKLHERGDLECKRVGMQLAVWWQDSDQDDATKDDDALVATTDD